MTTTPRDLLMLAMDMPSSRPVEPGDLSLALAGAELIELLRARAVELDGDRIVPAGDAAPGDLPDDADPESAGTEPAGTESTDNDDLPDEPVPDDGLPDDTLLAMARSELVRSEPYEPVVEWLWRRGRGLAAAYLDAMEADGQILRQRERRWLVFRSVRTVLVDTPARRRASHRWAAEEPVLAALAAATGIHDKRTGDAPEVSDDAVTTVIAAVGDAEAELAAERQRRARKLTDAAVENTHRGY